MLYRRTETLGKMKKFATYLVIFVISSAAAQDFRVHLQLTNGHLREVIFGCAENATDGYDRNLDDFAPPPGIETGYTVFLSADKKFPPFYQDIRGCEEKVSWNFYAKVYKDKPVKVQWNLQEFPATYDFTIKRKDDGGILDMKKENSITLENTQILTITAVRKDAVDGKDPDTVESEK